jgi:Zn-finger in Ran binding protein and others
MAEEQKMVQMTGPSGQTANVPVDSQGRPQTMKYLGTDHHSRKVLTGKFMSNVGPKNFGKKPLPNENWICSGCEKSNRSYLAKCLDCMTPRPY